MGSRRGSSVAPGFAAAAVFSSLSSYAGGEEEIPVHELYGVYCVVDVEKYRGSLTTHERALSHRHETIVLSEGDFLFWDSTHYLNPIYEIEEHPNAAQEGHIPDASQRMGTFYGFGLERDIVTTLSVHELSEQQPSYIFEVMGRQLWLFLDGWLYTLEQMTSHTCDRTVI